MERVRKQDVERLLAAVPGEYAFWCCDGRILKDMRELGKAFDTMTDEAFAYHANGGKRDFCNWVRDIIGDEELARELERAPNRIQAAQKVMERIVFLTGQLAQEKRTKQERGQGRKKTTRR